MTSTVQMVRASSPVTSSTASKYGAESPEANDREAIVVTRLSTLWVPSDAMNFTAATGRPARA